MKIFGFLFVLICNIFCFSSHCLSCDEIDEEKIRRNKRYFNFPDASFCSCYTQSKEIYAIKWLIIKYEENAESYFLSDVSYPREKWEWEYWNKMKEIQSLACKTSPRYRDVYHNALVFEKRIDFAADYKNQWYYDHYMWTGWCFSLEEKMKKIEDRRKITENHRMICKNLLYENISKIASEYIKLYESCLKKHFCKYSYHDYALLAYLHNNFDKSMELLSKIANEAEKTNQTDLLGSEHYHALGSICLEVMNYDKAIEYLSEAIKKDPTNKEAYFERAVAYFETGSFDLAINDYEVLEPQLSIDLKVPESFVGALFAGLKEGCKESVTEFVPSLCNSAYGLGRVFWTAVKDPMGSTKEFTTACYEITECVVEYCKDIDWETVDEYESKLKDLYANFDSLNDEDKGNLIGHTIGKYGVDFFGGGAVLKGVSAFRKLRTANRMCNLEAMTLSCGDKEAILASSLRHAEERQLFFKNVKIEIDKQNKHVPGKHNFDSKKSVLKHENPQQLLSRYAGQGQPVVSGLPLEPGYRERLDFKEFIGYYVNREKQLKLPTTKGIIHYSKKGAHIVPCDPNGSLI